MKHKATYLIIGFLLAGSFATTAQNTVQRSTIETDSTSIVVEKLFELAWAHYPQNRVKEHQAKQAYYSLKNTQFSWTESLVGQYNLNESNINPFSNGNSNVFYPRFLVGLRLSLSTFIKDPIEVRKAKEQYRASLSETDLQKVLLKGEIASKLESYRLGKKILKLKTHAWEESQTLQQVVKQKFQKNEITLEEYNSATIAHLSLTESKLTAESNFNQSKIDLETLIGVKMESIKLPSYF